MIRIKLLMAACCMQSVAVFAEKAPKGKLLSYSHTSRNAELSLDKDFTLSWTDGKGTLIVKNDVMMNKSEYTVEVSEDLFREAGDIIKQKKLYTVDKKEKDDPKYVPYAYPGRENFSLVFEDRSFSIDFMDITSEQRMAFETLETFIKERSRESLTAETLLEYNHSMDMSVVPPDEPDNYLYRMVSEGGKTTVMVNHQGENSPAVDAPQEVVGKVFQYFIDGHLSEPDSIILDEARHMSAQVNHSLEWVRFRFKNGTLSVQEFMLRKHCEALDKLDYYLETVYEAAPAAFPEGKMIYCSCAYTNYGLPVGEIRHSYYELIADEGKAPKVIYCEDRGDSKKTEYRATQKDVTELSNILREKNIFKLNGYNVDEQMMGGTSYRIYMEFSSGEKLNATWFTHRPVALASDAYSTILRFMEKVTKR